MALRPHDIIALDPASGLGLAGRAIVTSRSAHAGVEAAGRLPLASRLLLAPVPAPACTSSCSRGPAAVRCSSSPLRPRGEPRAPGTWRMPRHRGAAGLLAPGGPDWAGGRQALWLGECGPSGAPPGWMLSHLFVGGSHFGALTGVEIAGRDGGALGSSSELSLSDRKSCRGGARASPCGTRLWGLVPSFPCLCFAAARDAR